MLKVLTLYLLLTSGSVLINGEGNNNCTCLTGFPSLNDVMTSCSSCSFKGLNGNNVQLRLFPTMRIVCNGTLQKLTVAGMLAMDVNNRYPALQIWRPAFDDSQTYNRLSEMYEFPNSLHCSNPHETVHQCDLESPISVKVGDIIGLLLSSLNSNHGSFRIYFSSTNPTPHYILSSNAMTFNFPASSDNNAQPLIYLDIVKDQPPAVISVTATPTPIPNTDVTTILSITGTSTRAPTSNVITNSNITPTSTAMVPTSTMSSTSTMAPTSASTMKPTTAYQVAKSLTTGHISSQTIRLLSASMGVVTIMSFSSMKTGTNGEIVSTNEPITQSTVAFEAGALNVAGPAVGGIIAVMLLVLVTLIIVVSVFWSKKRIANKSIPHDYSRETDPVILNDEMNSTATGQIGPSPPSYILHNPNYDCSGIVITNELCDYDDIEEPPKKQSTGGYYSEVGVPNSDCSTPIPPELPYETPVATLGKNVSVSDQWSLVVPSQEQRSKVFSLESQNFRISSDNKEVYAAIGMSQYSSGGPAPKFFEECETYWMPSSIANELYEQLAAKKYREILRSQIQVTSFLGAGAFGTVSKGLWQSPGGTMEVAIKTMQSDNEEEKVKFLQEAAIMGQFRHPNVVKLMGVVTVGEPVMIVLELLSNGDLRSFLMKMKPEPGEMVPTNTPKLLLKFCQQISCGMEYLARKAFVHRDLAARNILVSEDKVCKISDFGMSRDLMDENYYVSHGGKIPVKWTSPEAIHYKKYSTASDVWSFGCVMYEIWSLGHKPFEAYTNVEAIKMIDKGARLSPPPGCPRELYKLLIECWHPKPSRRPLFAQLVEMLSQADFELLLWSEEDMQIGPQVSVVGSPLEASKNLYSDLQQVYLQRAIT